MKLLFISFLLFCQLLINLGSIFFKNVYGAAVLALIIYAYARYWGAGALTIPEIFLWVDGLADEMKSALIASFVSVIGFFMAFHNSHSNWKKQRYHEIGFRMAEEVNECIKPLSPEVSFYISYLVVSLKVCEKMEEDSEISEGEFAYLASEGERFQKSKAAIEQGAEDLSRIRMAYAFYTQSNKVVGKGLDTLVEGLQQLKVDLNVPPIFDEQNPCDKEWVSSIIKYFDYYKALKSARELSFLVGGSSGLIQGNLYSIVVKPNLSAYFDVVRDLKDFSSVLGRYIEKMRNTNNRN